MSLFSTIIFQVRYIRLEAFTLLLIIIISCRGMGERKPADSRLSENGIICTAKKIILEKKGDYTKVTVIDPWQGADNIRMIYHLVKRGSVLPDGMDTSMVIFVPLTKIICMSTTYVAMISALDELNTVRGMSGTGFVFSDVIAARAAKGLIEDVGYDASLNKELILKISPDVIMMYGIGSESSGHIGKIRELGINVIFNADYLETEPLNKAEWIKLFGALYCKENLADSIFKSEVEAYYNLKSYISRNVTLRPKVLLGLPFKDTWFVSPGNSFISALIDDAGGNYLWQDTRSSVSMPIGIENVYLKALDADYWLNIGTVKTKNEISGVDQRLRALPCFRNGNLYNNNKRITFRGGNDYWESGTVYPHLILKDLATILHPGLFIDTGLFYYRKIY